MINHVWHTGNGGDAPLVPVNPVDRTRTVEVWAGTSPIEMGQSVWICWQELDNQGNLIPIARSVEIERESRENPLHYTQCNWRNNSQDRSYWCGVIGPFSPNANRIIYNVFARQGRKVITISTPDYFSFTFEGQQPLPAPGGPGEEPVWCTGAKEGFGTSRSDTSRVWFSHSEGILNEIYYPYLDKPDTRDFQILVLDDNQKFVNPKDAPSTVQYLDTLRPGSDGIPRALAYRITNEDAPQSGENRRYQVVLDVLTDPMEDSVLVGLEYKPDNQQAENFRLFALINPHICNSGNQDCGKFIRYGGRQMFLSWENGIYCAMAINRPTPDYSCGFVGVNDGWKMLSENGGITDHYTEATDGNISGIMEIGLSQDNRRAVITLSFGRTEQEALDRALRTVVKNIDLVADQFIDEWHTYMNALETDGSLRTITTGYSSETVNLAYVSAMVIKAMEDKTYKGAVIASASIPWGDCTTDANQGGYHLVWPRDLYNMATAAMAVGDFPSAVDIMHYFDLIQQEEDGSMPQNSWIDGTHYWSNEQLDETGYPILLAYRLKKLGKLPSSTSNDIYRSFITPAADFLAGYENTWTQDRWEEGIGRSPFAVAVVVSALVVAARWSNEIEEISNANRYFESAARYATADLDDCYVSRNGRNYFARIYNPWNDWFKIFMDVIDAGFLELVRLGVKSPTNPKIESSLQVVDDCIRQEINGLPYFLRYGRVDGADQNGKDTYGEKNNGNCWTGDGSGYGRLWPFLSGERGHYEFEKNNDPAGVHMYLDAITASANAGYMLPEQVWNAPDIARDEHNNRLVKGKGTKSATPLGWTHGEFLKLLRSLKDGVVFDKMEEVEEWSRNTSVNGSSIYDL